MSYADFVNEAMQQYRSLPYEVNDLYKRYSVSVPLPEETGHGGPERQAGIEKLVSEISDKTRLKFDAIISDAHSESFNSMIRIIDAESAWEALEGKLFKSGENKLAAYVNGHAKTVVVLDLPDRSNEMFNILFVNSGNLSVQVLASVGEHASLGVSELYYSASDDGSTMSVLHEVSAAKGSRVELNALHNENEKTSIVNLCKVRSAERSKINANYVYCGGAATKSVCIMDSNGGSGNIDVMEFAYGSKSQNFDLNTTVLNSVPYSNTNLNSGVVLDDSSKCMLKGFAKVCEMTKGSCSKITERGILMSKDAHIDALPDMVIDYSNEVKATHSAATAPIDEEALFYLTSRGLDENKARKLFVAAFIAKYISAIQNPAMKEIAMSVALDKLDTKSFGVVSDITPRGIWA